MLSLDEYIRYWGRDNLLRYDPAVVASLSISEQAQQFLVEAGLPMSVGSDQFDIAPNDLPPLTEMKHRPYLPYDEKCTLDFPAEFERYRVLGIYYVREHPFDPEPVTTVAGFYCLDTLEEEQIVLITSDLHYRAITQHERWNVVFSNSRIDLFAAFLCLFKQHEDWERGARLWFAFVEYPTLYEMHGREMEPLFYAVDPPACNEGTSWWAFVLTVSQGIIG